MKRKVKLYALSSWVFLVGAAAMEEQIRIEVIDNIAGTSQRLIQVAMPEFERKGLQLDEYRVVVMRVNDHYVVAFEDANTNATETNRGSPLSRLSFEVEIDATGTRVVKAHFSR